MLEDLSWVCKETCPELRSLHITGRWIRQRQPGFAAASLYPVHSVGRRHVGTDVQKKGRTFNYDAFKGERKYYN